jgi:hypothetical protein
MQTVQSNYQERPFRQVSGSKGSGEAVAMLLAIREAQGSSQGPDTRTLTRSS